MSAPTGLERAADVSATIEQQGTALATGRHTRDVPTEIFEKFIEALSTADVTDAVTDRLRKTLLENRTLTDRALKAAVLGEEPRS